MSLGCPCCNGSCDYCNRMGYTWPFVSRLTNEMSECEHCLEEHFESHPCRVQMEEDEVRTDDQLANQTLIVEALPVEIQKRIKRQFGDNPPKLHPYPKPIVSIFEGMPELENNENEQVQVIVISSGDDEGTSEGENEENLGYEDLLGYSKRLKMDLESAQEKIKVLRRQRQILGNNYFKAKKRLAQTRRSLLISNQRNGCLLEIQEQLRDLVQHLRPQRFNQSIAGSKSQQLDKKEI